jgi:hypothetical protein
MTLSFVIRMLLVWLLALVQGADVTTCDRLWDMGPDSHLPPGKTYEEWYGSPALLCPTPGSPHHSFVLCLGPNC